MNNGVIRVSHQFFEDAMHPDLEELRRRDEFFHRLDTEMNLRYEGDDMIVDISDIDVEALMAN